MTSTLRNYLRTCRKRSGFTQKETAFLLGWKGGTKVSRYEHFSGEPGLKTALACEIIFQKPIREIFPGIFREVEQKTLEQARLLVEKLNLQEDDPLTNGKFEILNEISNQKT